MNDEDAMNQDRTVRQVLSGRDRLVVTGDFPGFTPESLFDGWTRPELLRRWWPQEAWVEPWVGGTYRLSWPGLGWQLRGRYHAFDRGRELAFSWRWDHDPEGATERRVVVTFAPAGEGAARLTIVHGPYDDSPADQKLRLDDHLAGRLHFTGRLRALRGGAGS